jgi:hypothetical protein
MQVISTNAVFLTLKDAPQPPREVPVTFAAPVTQAVAILTGFDAQFTRSDGDHHLGQIDVRLSTAAPVGNMFTVTVYFDLRDWSHERDDAYEGEVFFSVIGE